MAVGAVAMRQRLDVRIGEDIALVAFDDIEWFSLLTPALSVITHSVEDMGHIAVELLLQVINGEHPESVVLPSELIIRASSAGPAPAMAPATLPPSSRKN
jgi:LacI family transcriptional regulator